MALQIPVAHHQRMTTHLLIVDDSEQIRTSLHALLNTVEGISSIRQAATLGQALDSVRHDPPTLVILDMRLSDGMGMDFIEPIKRLAPAVLIAMLTVYSVSYTHLAAGWRC